MKRLYSVLFALVALVSVASAQDYIYLVKDGSVVKTYEASAVDYITFTKPAKEEAWSVKGTYKSAGLGTSYEATLTSYTDGSYSIVAPLGEEGYSIDFTVDSSNYMVITNAYKTSGSYYYVQASKSYYVKAYTTSGYSSYDESNTQTSGDLWFGCYTYNSSDEQQGSWGYDEFTWGASQE